MESALRGLDAGDPAVLAEQALYRDPFHDLHAAPACRAREAGRHQRGVGESGLGFEADQRGVVEAADRQALAGLGRGQQLEWNAHGGLRRQRVAQGFELGALRRGDQVAALDQAGRGIVVADVVGEIVEDLPRPARQLDVLLHRVVGAQDAARLRRGAVADLAALEHQHAAGAEFGQVPGHRGADHAGADDDHVGVVHESACSVGFMGRVCTMACVFSDAKHHCQRWRRLDCPLAPNWRSATATASASRANTDASVLLASLSSITFSLKG